MDTSTLAQLAKELATDIESLSSISLHDETHEAKRKILSNLAKIKISVSGPTEFLSHLTSQVRIEYIPK